MSICSLDSLVSNGLKTRVYSLSVSFKLITIDIYINVVAVTGKC